jgi:uncharacterized protein YndB with AHSA1/START domain
MNPTPTGRIDKTAAGTYDLILTRDFKAGIDDVWASVTESERTARWFGAWTGDAGPGRMIKLQMAFEEGMPWCDVQIDDCRPPHHLGVSMIDESGTVEMGVDLVENDGVTTLVLIQHIADPAAAESMGPGWEYYLDMLAASREGQPLPDFNDYYPSQASYFVAAAAQAQS